VQTAEKTIYSAAHAGCWADNCRGHYIGEKIIHTAEAHGFVIEDEDGEIEKAERYADYEHYHELTDEAEEFMQQFAAEGYWFGYHEHSGDWGLWEHMED
jgi:hypothetical protein